MQKTKQFQKKTQHHPFVIDAFFMEQSKFEMHLALKNILTFFLQSLSDLLENKERVNEPYTNLFKCHDRLIKIYDDLKPQLHEDVKVLIQEFLMESESIKRLLKTKEDSNKLSYEQKTILDTKRYIIEYLISTIENNLNFKNKKDAVVGE